MHLLFQIMFGDNPLNQHKQEDSLLPLFIVEILILRFT